MMHVDFLFETSAIIYLRVCLRLGLSTRIPLAAVGTQGECLFLLFSFRRIFPGTLLDTLVSPFHLIRVGAEGASFLKFNAFS